MHQLGFDRYAIIHFRCRDPSGRQSRLRCYALDSIVVSVFSQNLKGHLDMLLLSVLHDAPAHGYAVVERMAEISDGTFALGEGTIYPALRRLEKNGLLRSSWTTAKGRRRRIYQVTKKGEHALAQQRGEWERFALGVRRILEAPG